MRTKDSYTRCDVCQGRKQVHHSERECLSNTLEHWAWRARTDQALSPEDIARLARQNLSTFEDKRVQA